MQFLGLAAAFFVAGFVQFNTVLNRGALAYALWLLAFSATVYFLAWLGVGAFVVGAIVGSKLAIDHSKKALQ
ncbi:hypothetical protein [Flavobacterium sp.]|jgi:hypothetical protein|uniref:hypothetical protein n=1 Tax=Flavobacterium sp. TaxID=239 RepID=UPI0037BE95B1